MPATLETLFAEAAACRLCPAMEGRRRVLGPLNGEAGARLLFVGEAPGRLGAELHGIPFHGDVAGRNFERRLAAIGLRRSEVFVTNAVLCNPQTAGGRNRRPSPREIANCGGWLRRTIETVDPSAVVALGAVALRVLGRVEPHSLELARDAASAVGWFGRSLVPLYHPGARALARRSLEEQALDWRGMAEVVSSRRSRQRLDNIGR